MPYIEFWVARDIVFLAREKYRVLRVKISSRRIQHTVLKFTPTTLTVHVNDNKPN